MTKCTHEFHWFLSSCNETGWKCVLCNEKPGEPEGFSPQLDRSHTYQKVGGILNDLHDQQFIYVSNGIGGDAITEMVVDKCNATGRYDQDSILLFILEIENSGNGEFWKGISEGIIAGKDPRERCQCGKLAKIFVVGGPRYCSDECKKIFERQMMISEASQ